MNENRNLVTANAASKEFDMDNAIKVAIEFLKKFNYDPTEFGIKTIRDNWWSAKARLREIFRKHPNWDESQQAIIWESNYESGINTAEVDNFADWAYREIRKIFHEKYAYVFNTAEYTRARKKYKCLEYMREKYEDLRDYLNNCNSVWDVEGFYNNPYPYLDATIEEYYAETLEEYNASKREYDKIGEQFKDLGNGDYLCISQEHCNLINKIVEVFRKATMTLASAEWAEEVNALNLGITCHEGEKVTRVVSKIGKKIGLDQVTEWKTVTHNGQDQQKNYGWNYRYSYLCDALNPQYIEKYTVVSINMFDYWTMSFGTNWASCHTIDRDNIRHVPNNHYHGCYSAGTESYMLDSTSVVFYTVDANYKGKMWKADKDRRMMFHIDPSGKALVFGRLYPDGRDGGETGFAAQFRQVIQKILATCCDFPNLWVTKKGTCGEYVDSFGHHYKDYENYSDCGHSYSKELGTMPMIRVGHDAICPCCGEEHCSEGSIQCEDCDHPCDRECERCGAHNDGVYYCVDDNEWHDEDNWYMDDYDNRYYHDEDERIDIEDYSYHCTENAENDGWRYCEDESDWYREDDCYIDDYDNLCYHDDSERIDIRKGMYTYTYHSAENAENDGWTLNEETNEWERA